VEENREFKFSIVHHIGVLAEGAKGWKKEVNLVSWNDRPPKLDLREWDENHSKMGKGITLNPEEAGILKELIADVDGLFTRH
jgi:hypothetical protein